LFLLVYWLLLGISPNFVIPKLNLLYEDKVFPISDHEIMSIGYIRRSNKSL